MHDAYARPDAGPRNDIASSSTGTYIYRIADLTKIYGDGDVLANDSISLDIRPGEIFGIFGPNGAGKTTLVRQLAGLIKPTSGSIVLNGIDVVRRPEVIPHYVSYFAQAPWILWSLKVWEVIYFTGIFRGLSRKASREETERLLTHLDLMDIRDRLMEKISGGQSRLLGIAASLIALPPVLILDEPTNELDPINRSKLWDLFSRLCKEKKTTIILVTHNVLEAEQVVDRVMIIDHGKTIALGTPGELKARVDDRIRIEIKFKTGVPQSAVDFIRSFQDARELNTDKWQVFFPKKKAADVYSRILEKIDVELLDDFRMMTTTLEDVYIQMGGQSNDFRSS